MRVYIWELILSREFNLMNWGLIEQLKLDLEFTSRWGWYGIYDTVYILLNGYTHTVECFLIDIGHHLLHEGIHWVFRYKNYQLWNYKLILLPSWFALYNLCLLWWPAWSWYPILLQCVWVDCLYTIFNCLTTILDQLNCRCEVFREVGGLHRLTMLKWIRVSSWSVVILDCHHIWKPDWLWVSIKCWWISIHVLCLVEISLSPRGCMSIRCGAINLLNLFQYLTRVDWSIQIISSMVPASHESCLVWTPNISPLSRWLCWSTWLCSCKGLIPVNILLLHHLCLGICV